MQGHKNKLPLYFVDVDLHLKEHFSVTRGLNASANSTDQGQPVHSAHADLGQNCLLIIQLSVRQMTMLSHDSFSC